MSFFMPSFTTQMLFGHLLYQMLCKGYSDEYISILVSEALQSRAIVLKLHCA